MRGLLREHGWHLLWLGVAVVGFLLLSAPHTWTNTLALWCIYLGSNFAGVCHEAYHNRLREREATRLGLLGKVVNYPKKNPTPGPYSDMHN